MENTTNNKSEHYVCLGGCRGVSPVPGVCQAPDCANHNHELVKCNCMDGLHYDFDKSKFNSQTLWFKRKTYGWGWTPSSWQGWVVLLVYLLLMIKIATLMGVKLQSGSNAPISFVLPFIALTSIMIFICYKKGEKPKWQWGNKK